MNFNKMPALRIGALEVEIPIVQGGMGVGISLSNLTSAVANAGGIGVIATPGIGQFESDWDANPSKANKRALQREIRKTKAKTNGIIGVNVMVALSDFDDLVQCSVDEEVNMLFLGAGLPAIRNKFLERVLSGSKEPFKCSWKCLKSCDFKNVPYCIGLALTNAKKGDLEEGFAFAGANAYRVDKIISVKELIGTLVEEYMAAAMQRSTKAELPI